ncbi:T9SS type A sorting domain-containing protein [Chryseobacterium nematophagum]|nr:T9SS type A sorting domain-containing protein [Chryseobacterium nematophagum]
MTKKISITKSAAESFLFCIIFLLVLFANSTHAQTVCSGTAGILPNGVAYVNGVQVLSTSTGSVQNVGFTGFPLVCSPLSLGAGQGMAVGVTGSWSINLIFDKPVNDLMVLISGADTSSGAENFIFNSNIGTVSISSDNYCGMVIAGNQIITTAIGGGIYKIHSPISYTQLTMSGGGGSDGSNIGICSASINVLGVHDIAGMKDDIVDIFPTPTKDLITISSRENLKSYNIFDASGKMVLSSFLKGNKKEIDLSILKPGNYIITIETETKTINEKIIKQ